MFVHLQLPCRAVMLSELVMVNATDDAGVSEGNALSQEVLKYNSAEDAPRPC